ncbi:hypothetical protein M427DRAFT_57043 [Gonapodya prolifera JEL478]|uniref:Uncharacterized protein n=1 Tax=Gonapodya prolifera (strain JEL478) TaxID=1344416 RepID=A0A139AFH8_GONPJ|nr:hypothetical protein M427DRAFT_57043 [Gonapodya prolifera JEL478]|eukprot:KXS15175.1 hypothetical protein M427DRAFT_57043 [Gonapodya prolifera JEL478]
MLRDPRPSARPTSPAFTGPAARATRPIRQVDFTQPTRPTNSQRQRSLRFPLVPLRGARGNIVSTTNCSVCILLIAHHRHLPRRLAASHKLLEPPLVFLPFPLLITARLRPVP